ncbi:cytochrome P450 domain-containing protein [Rhizoctonia solani AG-1 IA]|uniref:Cytochrome P450 domain-containing protein n=1 Tax=Thanatephorus cucumeris (strain AG1-IA) TaxID=983506 RepID=L8WIT9_THACA|nr:cytochrome P450 domain-containing protein [Rhizoctonia solani AG-1 IA]
MSARGAICTEDFQCIHQHLRGYGTVRNIAVLGRTLKWNNYNVEFRNQQLADNDVIHIVKNIRWRGPVISFYGEPLTTYHSYLPSLLLLALFQKWWTMSKVSERHPPSPTSFPIVGSLFSIPPGMAHIAYMKLAGDIISLKLFGYDFVVLNSFRAAADTLDKRSSIYSDRLSMPMVQDPTLFNWGNQSALLGYGDLWRSHRRMLNNWLNARAVTQFHPIQEQHIQPLLRQLVRLVDDPQPFEKHFIYGLGGWKRTAYRWRMLKEQALSIPYEWTKAQIASGTAEPSILSTLLQNLTLTSHMKEDERESNLKEVAHVIVAAGTDTVNTFSITEVYTADCCGISQTSTALVAFVAAMVLNPDVQLKAQKELDTVLGPTSLPTMSDRERLPYMRKLIQEVLRWQPVAPTDDNYEGYDIRKVQLTSNESSSIGNVWLVSRLLSGSLTHRCTRAITRDEKIYKDPEAFDPDRFQDPDVPHAPVFGWGRRKCPGIHFAEASLFITIASLLATFTFSRRRGPDGREIIPDIENISNAIVMELKPFEFELKLRSPSHRQLIL